MSSMMRTATGILALAMAALAIGCSDRRSSEQEPNDSPGQATRIELNSTVDGFIGSAPDVDFFSFTVPEPQILDIRLSPAEKIDHGFIIGTLERTGIIPLKRVDDGRQNAPERLCNFHAKRGSYIIQIYHNPALSSLTAQKPYRLTIGSRPVRPNEELEANDSIDSANSITVNTEVRGYFSPGRNTLNRGPRAPGSEEDWFYFIFTAPVNGTRMLMDIELVGVPYVNSSVCAYAPDGALLACANIAGVGEGETLTGIPLNKTGKYSIMVTALESAANAEIPYLLTVRLRRAKE